MRDNLEKIRQAKLIVIKIGSSRISGNTEDINNFLFSLTSDVRKLRDMGKQVIIVSSGAVSQGRMIPVKNRKKGLLKKTGISEKQALAAMGQSKLMNLYESFFSKPNTPIAQILFGLHAIQDKSGFQNLKNTFKQLLDWNVVPIVNENDSISTEELQFGDNDILSSLVASITGADLLMLITGTNGFYHRKKRVPFIETITPEHMKAARGPVGPGTGGMRSKLLAADVMIHHGVPTAILPGSDQYCISRFIGGEDIGTLIDAGQQKKKMSETEIKKIFNEKFFKVM